MSMFDDKVWHALGRPQKWPRHRSEFRQRLAEMWLIAIGRWSLHRAWQAGYDDQVIMESQRRARGGQ